ncbi:hypothetical protein SLS62_009685 [Diatrype stigma]|uniref:AAA+ ATPase domain-containing protein n=1 Tax=Diatrype stigma TaxID=117547 RepID=A0AAN9UCE8_9PEZI
MGNLGDVISETTWKWSYKIRHLGQSSEKRLADYKKGSSDSRILPHGTKNNAKAKEANGSEAMPGSHPCVKTLYEGPGSTEGLKNWVDYPPRQLSKTAIRAQDRVAIVLYKAKDTDKPVVKNRFSVKCVRILVQNLDLVAALAPILKKEDEILDLTSRAYFDAPFRPFYFCYDEIVAKYRSLAPEDTLATFMLLLIKVLDEVFEELRSKKQCLLNNGLISYKLAWAYYVRDAPILSRGPNCEVLSKVVSTTYANLMGNAVLTLKAKILRFNGEAFMWEDCNLDIPEFEGKLPIRDLQHFPLEFHEDPPGIKDQMARRGCLVLNYQGLVYCTYDGVAMYTEDKQTSKYNVDGRILIDVVGYNKYHLKKGKYQDNNSKARATIVPGTGVRQRTPYHGSALNSEESIDNESGKPEKIESRQKVTKSKENKRLGPEDRQRNKDAMLARPDDLKFMAPFLEGFCLKYKQWFMFMVEDIGPITWNDEAFDHLVYDEQQKDLVLSFVQSHGSSNQQRLDDVVMGKGQGLVVLLSGPPGTGKTLTAEAVADRTRRPLFYLHAEDLGICAATLGANLKKIFDMATDWDAVILLDEADVFMAERHPHDIARNELVSIFLRELEYTRSIIFLTTNMYQTIDTAFRSRLSLHLLFQPLSVEARVAIWHKFLDRLPSARSTSTLLGAGTMSSSSCSQGVVSSLLSSGSGSGAVDVSEDDLVELAQWPLNGREIKTAIKMVKLWCDHKGHDLTLARLENGIKVTSPHASRGSRHSNHDLYD